MYVWAIDILHYIIYSFYFIQMCFGKKKKVDQPVVKQNVVVQPQGTTTTVLTQPVVTQPVIVNPVVNPVVTGPAARSELKKTL